jgi:signal peptidase
MAQPKRKLTPQERRRANLLMVRDLGGAVVAVLLIIGLMTAYAGVWPPMVVIESGSMMHQPDASSVGVIDTGDLTLVKSVGDASSVITYMQGQKTGYRTYGNFGDVIIYAKNCDRSLTPIIHRAITRVVLNASGNTFDFPELEPSQYDRAAGDSVVITVRSYHVNGPEGRDVQVTVNIRDIMATMPFGLHGGFLTKGDNNGGIDQLSLPYAPGHPNVSPVQPECVVGVARGELPWFGVLKLWLGRSGDAPPPNSVNNLVIALVAIIAVPFLLEAAWNRYGDRVKSRFPEPWRAGWHRFWDKWPGGKRRAQEREEAARERAEADERRAHRERGRRKRRLGGEDGEDEPSGED